jgi:hypothetical protein
MIHILYQMQIKILYTENLEKKKVSLFLLKNIFDILYSLKIYLNIKNWCKICNIGLKLVQIQYF